MDAPPSYSPLPTGDGAPVCLPPGAPKKSHEIGFLTSPKNAPSFFTILVKGGPPLFPSKERIYRIFWEGVKS
jgi:hypothetical protein